MAERAKNVYTEAYVSNCCIVRNSDDRGFDARRFKVFGGARCTKAFQNHRYNRVPETKHLSFE
ncbi:MAG: hypothetical protein Q9170_001183 [Blastenia crenularia]